MTQPASVWITSVVGAAGRRWSAVPYLPHELSSWGTNGFGDDIVTASDDATARIWDAESGREVFTLNGHEDGIRAIARNADGSRIATASEDQTARIREPSHVRHGQE